MKIVGALKKMCSMCTIVARGRKKMYVVCPKNPKHKQRQGRQKNPYGSK
eukprot:gene11799-5133_t